MRVTAATGLVLIVLSGCAATPPVDERARVLETDRAFARLALAQGTRAAFVAFAAPDAIMFRPGVGPVKGAPAISAAFDGQPPAQLDWTPETAEVAASGDLGYSWGWFRYLPQDGLLTTGNYVSIWRKQPDGQWKWVIDLGVVGPPKPR